MTSACRALTAALCALSLAPLATPASAAPTTHHWYGTVTRIVDGDTYLTDIAGDHTKTPVPIRMAGIQATEMHPTPECGATEATNRLKQLLPVGSKVRLSAYYTGSLSLGRPIRYTDKYDTKTKTYVDISRPLLREGLVIWKPEPVETARNAAYRVDSQVGINAGKNLFDSGYRGGPCALGPAQTAKLQTWISYDADGDDSTNINGEYTRIRNVGATSVTFDGWRMRDASHSLVRDQVTYWNFPAHTTLKPGEYLTVHEGTGTNRGHDFYIGKPKQSFQNIAASTHPAGWPGDGMYLVDPDGNLRSWAVYPCVPGLSCEHPDGLHVTDVSPYAAAGQESITVTNTSDHRADLTGLFLQKAGDTREFTPGTYLNPGEQVTVYSGSGTSTRTSQYWGRGMQYFMSNAGGQVELRTWDGYLLSTMNW